MKNLVKIVPTVLLLLIGHVTIQAQQNFSPDTYMKFLEAHQDYKASQLLEDHPPKTTYYSERQYPANLSNVPWYDTLDNRFGFTGDEKEFLKQNYFMVSERLASPDWASAFIEIYSNDLPLFLSTDFILSSVHNSYDAILQTIEWEFLEPNLKELLHAMYEQFPNMVNIYSDDERFAEVLSDVDLYISVALSLAEGEEYLPQFGSLAKFQEVIGAVEAGAMTTMTLFTESRTRKIDFSQFTPRGHYNKEIYTHDGIRTLEDYFKAMMWLGRIDFLMTAPPGNPWELDWTEDELRRMQLGALLTNELLFSCGKVENLTKHEEIISFMVGPDDNLTPEELQGLSNQFLSGAEDLFDGDSYLGFMEGLNASDDYGQKIMSNFFYVDPHSADPGKLPVSYKLLGQKFLVDSYVFSEVVYDRIIFEGKKIWRPLPDPLDAMAALGNEDALALLAGELEEYKYAGKMAGLKYLIEAYDDKFWQQSLYNSWLSAIRSLNPPESSNGLPYFMQTVAWHQEKLNTQLTSWAQLRHDNLLYGKQSYTGGTGCSYPYTYVEPYPELYGNLKSFSTLASDFFSDVLSGALVESRDRIVSYYSRYGEIMEKLELISIKELEGIRLNEEELTFLKTMISEIMVSGPSITGWYNSLFFDVQKGLSTDFTVADVHTQPTDIGGVVVGNVLHVGNGNINMGIFLADSPCNPGQYMAFAGPVSSFHQEVTSNFKRLTDQEWEEKFWMGGGKTPERPDWVSAYLLNETGRTFSDGRSLEGLAYTGTSVIPSNLTQVMDYLLLFPNPASKEAHLRFVLNETIEFGLTIYDASGRTLHVGEDQILAPAEHDIVLPIQEFQPGLYLVHVRIGKKYMIKELLVQ